MVTANNASMRQTRDTTNDDIEQQQQQQHQLLKRSKQKKRKTKQRQQRRRNDYSLFSLKSIVLNPSLYSLLIASVILSTSLLVALLVLHSSASSGTNDSNNNNVSIVAQSLRSLWESATTTETTTSTTEVATNQQHHHHHHPIYQEEHAPLFPLTRSDHIGFMLATVGLMIAAGGGIGGGGILVPIYILILGFSPKHAIPLSNITVLGGAVANTILNSRKRHPVADRPLVDWDLILVMEPLTIAGALLGAFLNKILPEMLLTILLVLLLSVTAQNSLTKAFKLYQAETRAMIQQEKQSELTRLVAKQQEQGEEQDGDENSDNDESDGEEDKMSDLEDADEEEEQQTEEPLVTKQETIVIPTSEHEEQLAKILEQERHVPTENIKILIVLFVVVLTLNLLKGGGAFRSPLGITCGSTAFWWANAAIFFWIFAVTWHCRNYLLLKYRQKAACDYEYLPGDIQWNQRATIVYPAVCCLAGFFAGMFGVGGGIVKGPLMLAMGVHPAVSSASSACMILFTSFTATTSFVVFGLLVPDYAVVCFAIGLGATFIGQIVLSYLMRKAQRNSYIAFSIGGVVLLSAFLMTIQSLLSMAAGEKHHAGGICGKGD